MLNNCFIVERSTIAAQSQKSGNLGTRFQVGFRPKLGKLRQDQESWQRLGKLRQIRKVHLKDKENWRWDLKKKKKKKKRSSHILAGKLGKLSQIRKIHWEHQENWESSLGKLGKFIWKIRKIEKVHQEHQEHQESSLGRLGKFIRKIRKIRKVHQENFPSILGKSSSVLGKFQLNIRKIQPQKTGSQSQKHFLQLWAGVIKDNAEYRSL